MDKYHETNPPTELKSTVLGRENSKKGKPFLTVVARKKEAPVSSDKQVVKKFQFVDRCLGNLAYVMRQSFASDLAKKAREDLRMIQQNYEKRDQEANELAAEVERLRECLDEAVTGLEWRVENEPETLEKSDYENLDKWKQALERSGE